MRNRLLVCAAVAAAVAVAWLPVRTSALGKPGLTPVPCPQQEWQSADPAFEALPGAKAFFGHYDGGLYRIEIPANWNGELVLYAHGYVANAGANGGNLRVGNHPIREHLVHEGFAWAASSYRCNGYVPGQGLLDTMALSDVFTKANDGRAPRRTYLTGTSMGGHVTVLGMHEFPASFAGGLAMCPAGPELFDYYGAVSAAAETITGVQFQRDTLRDDIEKMTAMLGTPPNYTDKGRQLASVEIQISGGPRPFAAEGLATRFIANMTSSAAALAGGTTPGNLALTNSYFHYSIDEGLGLTGDALNSRVRRKAADPKMRSASGPYEEIVPYDGKLERPLMTLHGTGDLFVPIFLEQTLKREVAGAGRQSLLVQRVMRVAGHCGFSQPEMIQAFGDLVRWVRDGAHPQGDNVDGDLRNAGLTFTNPRRPADPGGLTITAATSSAQSGSNGNGGAAAAKIDFVRDVQPIFRQNCYGCHGPRVQQNNFRLDRRADAMHGGTVSVIGPGNSAGSRLYLKLIGPQFGQQMPPTGALNAEQIATIKAWIDQGAEWPDDAANEAPAKPTPPLMKAVLNGSTADVRRLLDGGADVNASNDAGATALMWAVGDLDKMRALVERGANVNAVSSDGRTALMIAAGLPESAAASLLLERGADVNVKAPDLIGVTTPLVEAAKAGNAELVDVLLARGADANAAGPAALGLAMRAQCTKCVESLIAKTAPPILSILMVAGAPPTGPALATPMLLARGADPHVSSPDGYNLLMLTAASEAMPVDATQALLGKGLDVNATSPAGEKALDLAKRHGRTPIVDLLVKAGAKETAVTAPPAPSPAASPRAAVERAIPLLQRSDATFLKKSGCVSCHNNTLAAMTMSAARRRGVAVDDQAAREQARAIGRYLESWRERALQNRGIPGDSDTVSYILYGLAAQNYPADESTDAMARFLKRQQAAEGQWRIFAHRPPIESSDIEVTAMSMRALQVFAPKSDPSYQKSIAAAAAWLTNAKPRNTEDFVFRALGLSWASAPKAVVADAARQLVSTQRSDGGWAQLPSLDSDAYATGEALTALAQSGVVPATDAAFQRGVQFLLKTQLADGSWFVRRRAIALQPYFESGFPHGRDQFISAAATNWAATALTYAIRPGS